METILANRLRKRYRHLRKWARRNEITCFRLYDRDIPEFPLIVDWYDGEAVVWLYQRKRDETPAQSKVWQRQALAEVREGLELRHEQVFVKRRQRQQGNAQYERPVDATRAPAIAPARAARTCPSQMSWSGHKPSPPLSRR